MVVWSEHQVVGAYGQGGPSPHPSASQEAGKEPGEGIALKTYPSDLLPAARPHPLIFPWSPQTAPPG